MSVAPILKLALVYGSIVAAVVAIGGGAIGFAVSGVPGLVGGLLGSALSALFLALTALSMLIAGKVSRDGRSPVFFAVVLGIWVVKIVVFVVVAIWLRGQDWMDGSVFAAAVIAAVFGSLVADMVAFARARVPYVSDVKLPGQQSQKS